MEEMKVSVCLQSQTYQQLFCQGLGDSQRDSAIWLWQSVHVYMHVPTVLVVCVHACVCTIGREALQDKFLQISTVIIFGAWARCYCCHVALFSACPMKTWNPCTHEWDSGEPDSSHSNPTGIDIWLNSGCDIGLPKFNVSAMCQCQYWWQMRLIFCWF